MSVTCSHPTGYGPGPQVTSIWWSPDLPASYPGDHQPHSSR